MADKMKTWFVAEVFHGVWAIICHVCVRPTRWVLASVVNAGISLTERKKLWQNMLYVKFVLFILKGCSSFCRLCVSELLSGAGGEFLRRCFEILKTWRWDANECFALLIATTRFLVWQTRRDDGVLLPRLSLNSPWPDHYTRRSSLAEFYYSNELFVLSGVLDTAELVCSAQNHECLRSDALRGTSCVRKWRLAQRSNVTKLRQTWLSVLQAC